jgi:hypothetical protein
VSRISDLLASGYIARHCTNPRCAKCSARARWYRRKGWRASKTQVRKNSRKEVMPS